MNKNRVEQYFALARERYLIRERRLAGQPWPWSDQEVFQKYNLCNVFREHDKTTVWFDKNIRSQLRGQAVIEATVIFRWFNRIETGEIIKHLILDQWNSEEARILLEDVKPIVTGAYMIKTVTGKNKLEGFLQAVDEALPILKSLEGKWEPTLQGMHEQLVKVPYLGGFMAYEIVSDLRWTDVLGGARDIMSWANAGPGCVRGLSRIIYDTPRGMFTRNSQKSQDEMVEYMNVLLEMSQDDRLWPADWRQWEMREVEHWLCEYSKITGFLEDGKDPKRVYRPAELV